MFFSSPASARNRAAPAAETALVAAAWPSGFAGFGLVTTCEDCAVLEACEDWLERSPAKTQAPPPFCPNASGLLRGKVAGRG